MCNHNYTLNTLTQIYCCVNCGTTKTIEAAVEENNSKVIHKLLWNEHLRRFGLFTYIPFGVVLSSFEKYKMEMQPDWRRDRS